MNRLQAYRYELMPTGEQQRDMRRFSGASRFVFNKALALQKANHNAGEKFIGYMAMAKRLTDWRNGPETPWLKARIFLPKLGWLRYRNSRDMLGVAKNVTVSIQTEREVAQPVPTATTAIGIDVGIARFATLSDASFIAPLNSFKKHQDRLRRYQRAMSRKVKFSNNWKKAKARVQKLHSNIANGRKDFLHKASTTISQNHALVCIEDLQVRNMSSSAKGNAENPGMNVRAKSGLNKAILDQGWGEFRRQLGYKLAWNGGTLLAVPAQNTSRTCPCCGHVSKENRQTQAQFDCVVCGYKNHADVVGSINILERGHRLLACGEPVQSGRSMKQEPAEAIAHAYAA